MPSIAYYKDDDNKPGAGTSTDQLVSAQAGFIPQTYGRITGGHILGDNVMVDHFSNFVSVNLMTSISIEKNLAAKKTCERRADSQGVKVKAYHEENERYDEQMFLDAVQDVNKVIIFCAVGAHHQNGISEFHIKFLLWAQ